MKKTFMGVRLKRLREERRLTQAALAAKLNISLSYLNQLENNQRPLTLPVLLALNTAFGLDVSSFSEDDEARMISDLREAFADPGLGEVIATAELRELALNMPALGRAIISLHRKYSLATEHAAELAVRLGDDRRAENAALPSTPYEEVRDFFYTNHNHINELDEEAEALALKLELTPDTIIARLSEHLARKYDVSVLFDETSQRVHRRFDKSQKALHLSPYLRRGQQAFQLATQVAMTGFANELQRLVKNARFSNAETEGLARIGLANYFAGAVVMPYGKFLSSAERLRYDIELLEQEYQVGFETICHRLSTLQRNSERGIPFFFVRVDRAGNISKRQSATDFHFSRVGGTCPLWNVYEAFASPGKILTQLAQMPDGRTYLWIARTVSHHRGGYGSPGKTFAVALGCDLRHAERIVYSRGLDLSSPDSATPIGVGCKVCERLECAQRAFPPIGRPLRIDEAQSRFAPYNVARDQA
jgi:predicted transcriptional regulator/DNA-binding XRE family transcriptional regulator